MGAMPPPWPQLSLEIIDDESGKRTYFNIGPYPPRLWPEDIELLHGLWLELSDKGFGYKLHHRDVVRVALQRLQCDLQSPKDRVVIRDVKQEASEGRQHNGKTPGTQDDASEIDALLEPSDQQNFSDGESGRLH